VDVSVSSEVSASPAKLVTAMRYRDVAAAIEWLTATFGLEIQHVALDGDGSIAAAHLSAGTSLIILLPVEGTELDQLMAQPDEIGGAETQSCYLVVEDADLHYAKAKAAGAEFVLDFRQDANGDRGFSCRDPEGHIWSFGTYDPWEGRPLVKDALSVDELLRPSKRRSASRMAAMAAIGVVMGAAGWLLATVQHTAPSADEMQPKSELVGDKAREEAERAASPMGTQLAEARRAKTAAEGALKKAQAAQAEAERAARQLTTQLIEARHAEASADQALKAAEDAQAVAERAAGQMATQLTEAQHARAAAEGTLKAAQGARAEAGRTIEKLETQLTEERRAKVATEKALTAAQGARAEAEHTTGQLETQLAEARRAKAAAEKAVTAAQGARAEAEHTTGQLETQLTEERRAKAAAEKAFKEAEGARAEADRTREQLKTQLTEQRRAKAAAEKALTAAQGARAETERTKERLETQLGEAQGARAKAERTTQQLETQLAEARRAKGVTEQALKEAQGARAEAERVARQTEAQLAEARRAKAVAERSAKKAQARLGRAREEEYGTAEPPRRLAPIGELFSVEDMKRVVALAEEKQLPLPPIRMRKPSIELPKSLRRFVGIWASDSGFERTGRQSMIVVTNVLSGGHAVGFHVIGDPRDTSVLPGLPTQADFFAFVGRISGNEILIKTANPRIVGRLTSGNELNVTEGGRQGSLPGRVLLKPVWTLMDAESARGPE